MVITEAMDKERLNRYVLEAAKVAKRGQQSGLSSNSSVCSGGDVMQMLKPRYGC